MKKLLTILLTFVTLGINEVKAQGAKNIVINEVMTQNAQSIQDEYGTRLPWVEITNTAFSTYDVRDMYITTNRGVLSKELTTAERIKLMSRIPNDGTYTSLSAHKSLILFLNSSPEKGFHHLSQKIDGSRTEWIALYDADGRKLIDSVTVPKLIANTSYARKGSTEMAWSVMPANKVTPGTSNFSIQSESKVVKLKREDPHGFGITILCMGIVFSCLALLYVFFLIFGWIADRRGKIASTQPIKPVVQTAKKIEKVRHVTTNLLQDGFETKGRDKEIYIAVIAMALKQHAESIHDIESGIISIKPHDTDWTHHSF